MRGNWYNKSNSGRNYRCNYNANSNRVNNLNNHMNYNNHNNSNIGKLNRSVRYASGNDQAPAQHQ